MTARQALANHLSLVIEEFHPQKHTHLYNTIMAQINIASMQLQLQLQLKFLARSFIVTRLDTFDDSNNHPIVKYLLICNSKEVCLTATRHLSLALMTVWSWRLACLPHTCPTVPANFSTLGYAETSAYPIELVMYATHVIPHTSRLHEINLVR